MANVTGWNELMNGSIVEASFVLFNTSFKSNFLLLLFVTLSSVLYMKTKNTALTFSLGMIFFVMFYTQLAESPITVTSIILILTFELGLALYQIFWAK